MEGHGFSHAVKQAGSPSFCALCRPALRGGRGRYSQIESTACGTTEVVPFRCLASLYHAVFNSFLSWGRRVLLRVACKKSLDARSIQGSAQQIAETIWPGYLS
jgi:hypothetical protein